MKKEVFSNAELDRIIEIYADMVYRIATLRMHHSSDADDIFQEVFLRLVRHASELQSEEHIKAWLIRVTINCCNKHYESSWNKKTVYYDDQLEKEDSLADNDFDTETESEQWEQNFLQSSDEDIGLDNRDEEEEAVFEAVRALPEKYRDVIHLFYYEELSIKEISKILDRTEAAVKKQLSRARDGIKKYLMEGYYHERKL